MKFTTAKTTLGAAALAIGFLALGSSSAYATTVDYYTEASIDGSTMTGNPFANADLEGTILDGISISFTGIGWNGLSSTPQTVNAPSSISLGDVTVTDFGNADETFTDVPFTLEIFQTVPGTGNGTLIGSVSGEFTKDSANNPYLTFSNTSVSIDGVTYSLTYNPVQLVSPSVNDGVTSIQGYVSATPEPMTTALVGVGLLGLGLIRRRKA